MDRTREVSAAIRESGVVGIVREKDAETGERTARALLHAGLPVVEVSLVTPGALQVIERLAASEPAFIGAGTVLDADSVRAAHDAGARFIVSPIFVPEVIEAAAELQLATLPGVATATEAVAAMRAGADFAKVFPGRLYGPSGIRDLLAALPWLPVVPTGGVALEEVSDYIAAGSVAVGLGSALSAGSDAEIAQRIAALNRRIAGARAA